MWEINEIAYLSLTAIMSVVVLFIIAKILGKKQVAELDFIDYVLGITIGSIAAEMATDINDKPFYYYLIALAIYFLLDIVINFFSRTSPTLKHFFKGKPITVIYEGKLVYKNIKKAKIDVNDIIAMARSQGYFNLSDVAFAVFENNGKLSVMPKSDQKPTVAEDFDLNLPKASLPYYMVIDGRISYSSLTALNQNEQWLYNKLNVKTRADLENILLAIYDEKTNKMDISKKSS